MKLEDMFDTILNGVVTYVNAFNDLNITFMGQPLTFGKVFAFLIVTELVEIVIFSKKNDDEGED